MNVDVCKNLYKCHFSLNSNEKINNLLFGYMDIDLLFVNVWIFWFTWKIEWFLYMTIMEKLMNNCSQTSLAIHEK